MSAWTRAFWAEALKARRSRMPWLTLLGFSLAPLMGGLFMLILKDPEWARRFGLISAKAEITAGTADWPAYLSLLTQAVAVGGFLLFGLVTVWVFGREYANHTITDLLALPTPRLAIVLAKFGVIACWAAALTAFVYVLGVALGALVGLPDWSPQLALASSGRVAAAGGLTILLVYPLAAVASASRGYLPAVGAMFLAVFLSQVVAALGWGAYFPWSVPALTSGVAGPSAQEVGVVSYLLVALTGLAGIAGTAAWWRFADQS